MDMEILNDFNTSVEKSLSEIDPNWKEYEGLIVCGTHSPKNWEGQIEKIKYARQKSLPFLGICMGHQLAFIEMARANGIKDATSEEFGEKGTFVVRKRQKLRVGMHEVNFKGELRLESFWNNYEVNPIFFTNIFVGLRIDDNIDLFIGINDDNTPFFWTTQFHPEYQSSKEKPHPILVEFLKHAREYTRNMAV